jgi:lipopolysaccharide exporter
VTRALDSDPDTDFGNQTAKSSLGSFAGSVAVVGIATAFGQGALVVAGPVLARLYDPEAFGLLSVYSAVLFILLAASSLRFDLAIPIASDPVEAVHLLMLSITLALMTSLILGAILLAWGAPLADALGAMPLTPFLWLLPIALFVSSVAQALSSWSTYHRSFPAIGRMRAMQGVTQAISQGVLGVAHAGPFGLLLGDAAGRLVGIEQLLRKLFATLRATDLSFAATLRYARERWGFARVMTAASLLNAVSLQVPFLLIPSLFDLQASGQYFLAYRVLVLPAALVAAAVSQVFFGEASSRREDPQGLHDLARSATVALFVFSIPTYAIVAVAGAGLIETVFGAQWRLAGVYAQIMAPWVLVWSVASPISALLLIGRRERESLAFTTAELGLKAASLGIGAVLNSLTAGLVILTVVSVLISVAAVWRFLRVASVRLQELVRPTARIAALTAPFLGLVIVVGTLVPTAVPLACAAGWALAFGLGVRFSPEPLLLLSRSK